MFAASSRFIEDGTVDFRGGYVSGVGSEAVEGGGTEGEGEEFGLGKMAEID